MLENNLTDLQEASQSSKATPISLQVQMADDAPEKTIDIRKTLRIYIKKWPAILLCTLLGGLLGYGITLLMHPVYEATSGGILTAPSSGNQLGGINNSVSADMLVKSKAKTYTTVATSKPVAEGVIKKLNLQTSPEDLVKQIKVENTSDTPVITITAKGSNPQNAKDLADTWVASLADEIHSIENNQSTTTANPDAQDQQQGNNSNALKLVPNVSASLPDSPASPNKKLFTGVGLVLGLLAGLLYAWYQGRLDTRIRSRAALEDNFPDTPIIGLVPESTHPKELINVDSTAPHNPEAYRSLEAFRNIRTNLRFANIDRKLTAVAVTSPEPQDGKSTVISNLALAIAASGQRVVIIDADLRRPTIDKKFDITGTHIGLTELLTDQVDLQDALINLPEDPNVFVLPAGTIPPNPTELLQSHAMENLIETLRAENCIILIDTPPLLAVSDSAAVSHFVDGTIVVVSANESKIEDIKESLGMLSQVNARILGIVLNKVPVTGIDSQYYGYSSKNNYYYSNSGIPNKKKKLKKRHKR
ncbi:MAG: polysaccharide biosynthesis tyrosine autokinase [Micrococcaceae bacterium]